VSAQRKNVNPVIRNWKLNLFWKKGKEILKRIKPFSKNPNRFNPSPLGRILNCS